MKRIITPILTALVLTAPVAAPSIINPPTAHAQVQDQPAYAPRQSFTHPFPKDVTYEDFRTIYKLKLKDQYGTMLDSRHLYDTMRSPEYTKRAEKAWDTAMANRPEFLDDMMEKNDYVGKLGQALAYADEQGNIVMLIPETVPGNGYIAYNNAEPQAPLQEGPGPEGKPQGNNTNNAPSRGDNNDSTEDGGAGFDIFAPDGDENNKDSQSSDPNATLGEGSQFEVDENGNPINTNDAQDADTSDTDEGMSTSTIIGLVVSLLILAGVGIYVFMRRRKDNNSDDEQTNELPANWNDK